MPSLGDNTPARGASPAVLTEGQRLYQEEKRLFARTPTPQLRNIRRALGFHSFANSARERARLKAVSDILKERRLGVG